MKNTWLTQDWTTGQLNALVKHVGEDNARAIISGKAKIEVTMLSFERLETISLPALPRFVARDHFGQSTSVQIANVSPLFVDFFMGKVEESTAPEELTAHRLLKDLTNEEILPELGQSEKREITLSQLWELLERQNTGEAGFLQTGGRVSIFFIRDVKGKLRAVSVSYRPDLHGWTIWAYEKGGRPWTAEACQVICCN